MTDQRTKKTGKISTIRQLVLAKEMFLIGYSHAQNTDEISRMIAIHAFDNSLEMILKLKAIKIGLNMPKGKKDWDFYDLLIGTLKDHPMRNQIQGLHEQRNRVHHSADIPARETVIKYGGYVEDFLKDIYQKDFNLSYEKISLSLFINNTQLRELFQKAEQCFGEEQYIESIHHAEEVFYKAVFNIADIFSKAGILTGYFNGGNELRKIIKDTYAEKYKNSDHYGFVKEVSKAFLQLSMSATTMQFLDKHRIDFLRHRKRVENLDQIPDEKLKSEAQESLNFILNIILKWQEEKIL